MKKVSKIDKLKIVCVNSLVKVFLTEAVKMGRSDLVESFKEYLQTIMFELKNNEEKEVK